MSTLAQITARKKAEQQAAEDVASKQKATLPQTSDTPTSEVQTGMMSSVETPGNRFGTRDEFLVTPNPEISTIDPQDLPENTFKMGKVKRIVLASGKAVEADKNGFIVADTEEKLEMLMHFESQNRGLATKVS